MPTMLAVLWPTQSFGMCSPVARVVLFTVLLYETCATVNISCYECEIVDRERQMTLWPCDKSMGQWQESHGCRACIKIEEIQRTDYRKPRWRQQYYELKTESRLCLRKFDPMFMDECIQTYGSALTQKRCYCQTDYCNSSPGIHLSQWIIVVCCIFCFIHSELANTWSCEFPGEWNQTFPFFLQTGSEHCLHAFIVRDRYISTKIGLFQMFLPLPAYSYSVFFTMVRSIYPINFLAGCYSNLFISDVFDGVTKVLET